jgi:hypothetical protein
MKAVGGQAARPRIGGWVNPTADTSGHTMSARGRYSAPLAL